MNLVRSLGSVGGLTLVSRVLALVRDTLQASYVGAGFASDAFFVAFRLPNLFRRLFAEGAFSAAFVPLFGRALAEGGEAGARRLAEDVLAVFLMALVVVTALAEIAAPLLVMVLAPGFSADPDKFSAAEAMSAPRTPGKPEATSCAAAAVRPPSVT